jgi:replicative DNA helicase
MGQLHTEGFEAAGEVGEYVERVERAVLSLANERPKPARNWAQAVVEARAEFDAMLQIRAGTVMPGEVSWGFSDMDRYFGPLQPGQLAILAARPSVGKSSLMRQTALAALREGRGAFIASLEVKDRAIARNIAQSITGLSYRGFRDNRHAREIEEFRKALETVEKLPLHVADNFSATVSQICAQARLLKSKANIGLVCVDHLHELGECKNPPKGSNVAQAYGRAVKSFKELAGELEVPVLVLAQLNRGVEHDKRLPSLSDLRDSGNIEEAADRVLFLHRPPENPHTKAPQDETSRVSDHPTFYVAALQAKGRDEGTGSVALQFQRACARFIQFRV